MSIFQYQCPSSTFSLTLQRFRNEEHNNEQLMLTFVMVVSQPKKDDVNTCLHILGVSLLTEPRSSVHMHALRCPGNACTCSRTPPDSSQADLILLPASDPHLHATWLPASSLLPLGAFQTVAWPLQKLVAKRPRSGGASPKSLQHLSSRPVHCTTLATSRRCRAKRLLQPQPSWTRHCHFSGPPCTTLATRAG